MSLEHNVEAHGMQGRIPYHSMPLIVVLLFDFAIDETQKIGEVYSMKYRYVIQTKGGTFTRNSKRDDFRFAVAYRCSIDGWRVAGLRTLKDDAEQLRTSYAANEETQVIQIKPLAQ